MTSLINKDMSDRDYQNEDYIFDLEQYNYVIEKKSALSDIDLLSNPAKLEFILKNFEKNDKVLLD